MKWTRGVGGTTEEKKKIIEEQERRRRGVEARGLNLTAHNVRHCVPRLRLLSS